MTRVNLLPILEAEKILASKQRESNFEATKKETIKILETLKKSLPNFNMNVATPEIYGRFNHVLLRHVIPLRMNPNPFSMNPQSTTFEEAVINSKDKYELEVVQRGIALSTFLQLGAVSFNMGSWRYESPNLGWEVTLANFRTHYWHENDDTQWHIFDITDFDIDRAFQDIPLLIEKAEELTKKVQTR